MPLGMEVGLEPGDFVLDGDPAPRTKKKFGPCLFGQMAGWIRMLLGTEVGLGTGDILLPADTACPSFFGGGGGSPIFDACL